MCRIILINSMTLSKKYSTTIIASIIVAVLAIGISFQGSTAETLEFDPTEASVNNMQIIVSLHLANYGKLSLETFSVYQQVSGFKKGESASFKLFGLAGIDKVGWYKLADKSASQRFGNVNSLINDFGVDVKIVQNEQVLHEFKYTGCEIADYKVTTLFDADETYSGKTKFAIVDGFEFLCKGYHPNTPLFDELVLKIRKGGTLSTTDLTPGVTWEAYPQFQNQGFKP